MSEYRGCTHPRLLGRRPFVWLWELFLCPKEMHLFDEVFASGSDPFGNKTSHYLSCDACGLAVFISGFETMDQLTERLKAERGRG